MVLILVLMEDTLREQREQCNTCSPYRLNPCFNGRYSQRAVGTAVGVLIGVLILVLMEDTLRGN